MKDEDIDIKELIESAKRATRRHLDSCCTAFGCSIEEVKGKNRRQDLALSRHTARYVFSKFLTKYMSYAEMAVHHWVMRSPTGTIIHSLKTSQELLDSASYIHPKSNKGIALSILDRSLSKIGANTFSGRDIRIGLTHDISYKDVRRMFMKAFGDEIISSQMMSVVVRLDIDHESAMLSDIIHVLKAVHQSGQVKPDDMPVLIDGYFKVNQIIRMNGHSVPDFEPAESIDEGV